MHFSDAQGFYLPSTSGLDQAEQPVADQCSEVGLRGGTCGAPRARRLADHLDGLDIADYVVNDQATLGQLIDSIASHVAKVAAAGVVAAPVEWERRQSAP
jgi:hypothetical protein